MTAVFPDRLEVARSGTHADGLGGGRIVRVIGRHPGELIVAPVHTCGRVERGWVWTRIGV